MISFQPKRPTGLRNNPGRIAPKSFRRAEENEADDNTDVGETEEERKIREEREKLEREEAV